MSTPIARRGRGRNLFWRIARWAIVCLLLGTATTFGVAWGLCLRMEWYPPRTAGWTSGQGIDWAAGQHRVFVNSSERAGQQKWWVVAVTQQQNQSPPVASGDLGTIPAELRPIVVPWIEGVAAWPPAPERHYVNAGVYGWPAHAACWTSYEVYNFRSPRMVVHGFVPQWVIRAADSVGLHPQAEHLPVLPLWRGVAVDTLFYAAVWCVVLWAGSRGGRALRTRRRRRRGWCIKCTYDLKGEFERGCPECGWGRGEK